MKDVKLEDSTTKPLFAARLTPYRSLGKTGFLILMAIVATTCFISGMLFLVIGAWPVFGFFGLDLLLIWGAFKLNYRSGRMVEAVEIYRDELVYRSISPSGKISERSFNPFWTRLNISRHDEIGITRMSLSEKGEELVIASFLNPLDKESFALAFSNALFKAKAG